MNRMQLTEAQPRSQGRIPFGAVALVMAVVVATAAVAGGVMSLRQPVVGPSAVPSIPPAPPTAAPTIAPSTTPAPTPTPTPTPAPQVGLSWQRVTDPDIMMGPYGSMYGVIAGGPGAIAWGEVYATGPRIWFTTNGRDWTKASVEAPTDFDPDQKAPGAVLDLTRGGPGFVAVGVYSRAQVVKTDTGSTIDRSQNAIIWTSTDGKTWQMVPNGPVFHDANMGNVIAWKGGLLAFGCAGCGMEAGPTVVWSSTDGRSWTKFSPTLPAGSAVIGNVTATADALWGIGGPVPQSGDPNPPQARPTLTSLDGRTWTAAAPPATQLLSRNVTAVGDTLVKVGSATKGCSNEQGTCPAAAWRSTDAGVTWTSVPVTGTRPAGVTGSIMTAVAALGDGTLVAVGDDRSGGYTATAAWVSLPQPGQATRPTGDPGDQVSCTAATTGSIDHLAGARGLPGDVLAIAAKQILGLRPADRVELASSAGADTATVRVVRDGTVIAIAIYDADGAGGWLISTTITCSGLGLSWGA
ncbi:MAG TPA: hypothetical protein VIR16_06740 [Candidatus Limnocylindrales bacterium]